MIVYQCELIENVSLCNAQNTEIPTDIDVPDDDNDDVEVEDARIV